MSAPRFPAVAAPPRPLRVLLPARGRPGERPLGLDPPHRLQAPRRPGDRRAVVHAVRRRRSPSRARSSSRCPTRAPATGSSSARATSGPTARAAARRRQGRSAAWELSFGPASEPLRHLPHPKLYDAPLPRTKTESPLPDTTISGWVEADGERWELDAWPGMVGHNWGAEHAERWIWLHGVGFDGAPDAWLDVALGRIRIGPRHHALDRQRRAAPRRRADPARRPRPPRARRRARRRRHDRGQRRAHRGARGTARLVGLLRPLRRRAPQHELLDRVRRADAAAAARCAPPTAARGSSGRARRRPASRFSRSRIRDRAARAASPAPRGARPAPAARGRRSRRPAS